jgi:hypothetical protein
MFLAIGVLLKLISGRWQLKPETHKAKQFILESKIFAKM